MDISRETPKSLLYWNWFCAGLFLVLGITFYSFQVYFSYFRESASFIALVDSIRSTTDLESLRQAALSCVAPEPKAAWRKWLPSDATTFILLAGFCFLVSAVSIKQAFRAKNAGASTNVLQPGDQDGRDASAAVARAGVRRSSRTLCAIAACTI
jgi:hypothetical protein